MKVRMDQKLTNMDGTGLELNLGSREVPRIVKNATLSVVAIEALLAFVPSEMQTLTGDEKAKRYEAAFGLRDKKEVNLKIEDVALIKKLVGEMFGPLIVGQVYRMLEGE